MAVLAALGAVLLVVPGARAESLGPYSFEPPAFVPLRAHPAVRRDRRRGGRRRRRRHLDYSFSFGTVTAAHQPGLRISVSASDQGSSRLTYLRFEDQEDGVHVFFADAVNPGPLGAFTDFPETDIATLDRGASHRVRVLARFVEGGGGIPEGNDVVKVLIDGETVHVGGTWEDYYRNDPEQAINGNELPVIDQVFFRLAGNTVTHPGGGFLVDQISVASAPLSAPVNVEPPATSLFDQSATASSDAVTIAQPATPPPQPLPAPQPAPAPPPPPPPTDDEPEVETPRGPAGVQGATAAVAVVSCGADAPCVLDVPRRVRVRIGGKTYFVLVRAPRRVAPGTTARIRIKFPRAALKALRQASRRQGTVRLPITVRTGGERTTQGIRAKVRLRSGSVKRG